MSGRPRDKLWSPEDSKKWRKRFAPMLPLPCPRCRKPVLPEQAWDVDHIIAISEGGTKTADNLTPAHRRCNNSHGGKLGAAKTNAKRATDRGLIQW